MTTMSSTTVDIIAQHHLSMCNLPMPFLDFNLRLSTFVDDERKKYELDLLEDSMDREVSHSTPRYQELKDQLKYYLNRHKELINEQLLGLVHRRYNIVFDGVVIKNIDNRELTERVPRADLRNLK